MTKKKFAECIGMKPSNFSRMLKKKGELTSEMAMKLEVALDIPYRHWMRYQEQYLKDCARYNFSSLNETTDSRSSNNEEENAYENIYQKIYLAIRPVRERMESINALLSSQDSNTSGNISREQISTFENDIHQLGRALCELRLT